MGYSGRDEQAPTATPYAIVPFMHPWGFVLVRPVEFEFPFYIDLQNPGRKDTDTRTSGRWLG